MLKLTLAQCLQDRWACAMKRELTWKGPFYLSLWLSFSIFIHHKKFQFWASYFAFIIKTCNYDHFQRCLLQFLSVCSLVIVHIFYFPVVVFCNPSPWLAYPKGSDWLLKFILLYFYDKRNSLGQWLYLFIFAKISRQLTLCK